MHDTTLTRTTNARALFPTRDPWAVSDSTYDELRRLDAGSWQSPALADEPVPTLREALEVLHRSGAGLLLELKAPQRYPGIVGEVVEAIRDVPGYLSGSLGAGRLVVQSFNVVAMKELKTLAPVVHVWTADRERAINRALRLGVDGIITNRPGALARVMRERAAAPAH